MGQMSRSKLSHHRAYACFRRKMECHKCKVILTLVGRNVSLTALPDVENTPVVMQLADKRGRDTILPGTTNQSPSVPSADFHVR
jgi:hypothetical protein